MSAAAPLSIIPKHPEKAKELRYVGLQGAARAWLVAQLYSHFPQLMIVCRDSKSAEEIYDDLEFFLGSNALCTLSAWDSLPFEHISPQTNISAQRLAALSQCSGSNPYICITPIEALMQKIIPPNLIAPLEFSLKLGDSVPREILETKILACGFSKVSLVEEIGEFAPRGSVLDLFPSQHTLPVRIEFEHDRIKNIRTFDSDSQRSLDQLESISILPVREVFPLQQTSNGEPLLRSAVERVKRRGRELETPPREIVKVTSALKSATLIPGIELFYAIGLDRLSSVFECLSSSTRFVILDEIGIEQSVDKLWEIIEEREVRLSGEHYLIPKKEDLYLDPKSVLDSLRKFPRVSLDQVELLREEEVSESFRRKIRSFLNTELITKLKTRVGTGSALEPLAQEVHRLRKLGFDIAFVTGSKTRSDRLSRLLLDLNIDALPSDLSGSAWSSSSKRYPVVILPGHLTSGVQLPDQKLAFISESEIFAERSYKKSRSAKTNLKKILGSLAQLKEGDHVVHTDYGIGIYRGLKHLEIEHNESDFLQIEYADSALYLPVQNIGKVQKFTAAEGQSPVLDKLSSNRWTQTKLKVRQSVVSLAGDLIRLYAARSIVKGWRYDVYGAEDDRFSDGFAYSETPDQLKAIHETLQNMASDKPMDRLVCGDVGFGKTEVALRAAFKASQHARQVAVLVPTTILVDQHRQNFEERFRGYPVKIGAVSRFFKPEANRKTLQQLSTGELDIIIGTHRLLSKDVQFKDLGLVIIDEEHRFGVKQKEKLKQMRKQVDVLTLTATPIPRTLHMSLLGIRDISIISTPPHDRRVIRTYTSPYDPTIARDAILRELQRGGQCFFVHNRVQSIALTTDTLRQLVPEARFEFAHGQMSENALEQIMRRFMQHETDVLVTTTIIESGLDIPNANTILIDRADTYGLAQLYQLRGRVGRSTRQAYAFFFVPRARKLGHEAQQRLKALQSLDDLGLGFNLALRDMEIRGAGNLLGKEQSGSVVAVGFDLYCRILEEAVLNLKGEELSLEDSIDPEVKLYLDAFIPDTYIPDLPERMVLYQRLAALASDQETDDLKAEIEDRFGPIGKEVDNLIELMRLRGLLKRSGIVSAEFANSKLSLSFSPRAPIDIQKILKLIHSKPEKFKFSKSQSLTITCSFAIIESPKEILEVVEDVLQTITNAQP